MACAWRAKWRGLAGFLARFAGRRGRKVYESPMLRGGGTYKQLGVDIADVNELKLIVTDAGDGQSCDQAAWCDAKVLDADGKVTYLSDLKPVSAKQGYDVLHTDLDIDYQQNCLIACADACH